MSPNLKNSFPENPVQMRIWRLSSVNNMYAFFNDYEGNEDNAKYKMNLYFTFEFGNCV